MKWDRLAPACEDREPEPQGADRVCVVIFGWLMIFVIAALILY